MDRRLQSKHALAMSNGERKRLHLTFGFTLLFAIGFLGAARGAHSGSAWQDQAQPAVMSQELAASIRSECSYLSDASLHECIYAMLARARAASLPENPPARPGQRADGV